MDELDRMFRRLVHNVRAGYPDLLTRSFEVSALYQTLIPYRLNRTELRIDSADEYELTLMRLLAGTRGLLSGDPDMQAALQAELETPNPDLSLFRAWSASAVSINAQAVRALDSQASAVRSPSPPIPTRQAEMADRLTLEVPASAAATVAGSGASGASRVGQPVLSPPVSRSIPSAPPAAVSAPAHGGSCRYCGGELPEGRDVLFCPHCGQNLSVKQCPACSTELEVEWQFCITCGRQAE
ncbi:MAG TPA: zinc ribbon domain-containing protein [Gemmatimonadaceae bacterium]